MRYEKTCFKAEHEQLKGREAGQTIVRVFRNDFDDLAASNIK